MLRLENLSVEGMFTHLSRADEAGEGAAFTEEQTRRFRAVRNRLRNRGTAVPFCHVCNSAAALTGSGDDRLFDGVRLGIALYGVSPVDSGLPLIPVMRLCSVVTHIHRVSGGEGVGYGAAWRADGERVIATLPIGYADGLSRNLSNQMEVLAGGTRCRQVGRICMDQFMFAVDVNPSRSFRPAHPVNYGDVVTVIGTDGDLAITADDHARLRDTINYEVTCDFGLRLEKVYV